MKFLNINKYSVLVLILLAIITIGCDKEPIIAEFGDDNYSEKYNQKEFFEILSKHNGGGVKADTVSFNDRKKFLELYLKFRIKVAEAINRGYLNDAEVKTEIAEYKKNLSASFLIDKELVVPELKTMYNRSLTEHRASHILIQYAPEDTILGYNKALQIIDSLKKGVSFEELALRNSEDPSAKTNSGDLNYFTSGAMVKEFEDAVYNSPVGAISELPIKTQFGYHIIKVTDRKPAVGTIHVSHIMKRFAQGATEKDSSDAWELYRAIADTIKKANPSDRLNIFSEMASKYSDDIYSKKSGGDIGPITRRSTIPEFDKVVFNLKEKEPSEVFKTPYGIHIAIVTSVEPKKSFDEVKQSLQETYTQYFYPSAIIKFTEQLKKKHNLISGDTKIFIELSLQTDTNATTANHDWDSSITSDLRKKIIFTIGGEKVSVDSVLNEAKTHPELQAISFKDPSAYATIVNKIADKMILEFEARKVENNYNDFKTIMKEYVDGVLLFKVEQNDVWNAVKSDSISLVNYYNKNISNYNWPDRVNLQEIYVQNDSVAKVVQNYLNGFMSYDTVLAKKKNAKPKLIEKMVGPISFDSAATMFNTRYETKSENGVYGLQNVSTNELTKAAWNIENLNDTKKVPYEMGVSIIKLLEKDSARTKTFIEALPEVSSAFQEQETKRLEEELNKKLSQKYKLKINEENFKKFNSK